MDTSVKSERISFTSVKNPLDFPDFLDIQVKSFQDHPLFLQNMAKFNLEFCF